MKKNNGRTWLIILSIIVTLVAWNMISNANGPMYTTAQVAHVATKAPTAKPTIPPTPTPLSATQREFAPLLNAISGYGQNFTITTDNNSITIIDDWAGVSQPQLDGAFAQIEIFNIMKLLWTQWKQQWPYVSVVIRTPTLENTPVAFAWAFLSHDTEQSFDWKNLRPGSAWKIYDSAFLDPSAQPSTK